MKRIAWIAILGLASSPFAWAGEKDAKEDVKAAAKKLAEQPNYSWTSTSKNEGDAGGQQGRRLQVGPTDGKAEKDGLVSITTKVGENAVEAVLKGEKMAIKSADGWKAGSELAQGQGGQGARRDPSAMAARMLRTFKAPAAQAETLADKAKELKAGDEGVISGELTEDGVKELLSGGGRGGQNAPQVAEPKGSVKFWIKDGVLSKLEYNVQGKMTFGQREVAINRTSTVEIKDVGATKVEVPEDAKKKLE